MENKSRQTIVCRDVSLSKKYDFAPSQSLPCVKGGGPPNGGSEGLRMKDYVFALDSMKL